MNYIVITCAVRKGLNTGLSAHLWGLSWKRTHRNCQIMPVINFEKRFSCTYLTSSKKWFVGPVAIICERFADGAALLWLVRSGGNLWALSRSWHWAERWLGGSAAQKTIIIQWTPNCLLNGLYSRYIFVRAGHRRIRLIEGTASSLCLISNLMKGTLLQLFICLRLVPLPGFCFGV